MTEKEILIGDLRGVIESGFMEVELDAFKNAVCKALIYVIEQLEEVPKKTYYFTGRGRE